ncbi:hypothetical protein AVEN_25822-1, partial [Araneus ventricosus]
GLLKGIKRRGHSLGLVLRVVTVPGSDPGGITQSRWLPSLVELRGGRCRRA